MLPAPSDDVVHVAWYDPAARVSCSAGHPVIGLPAAVNETVPPPSVGETVAVNDTCSPVGRRLSEEATVVRRSSQPYFLGEACSRRGVG